MENLQEELREILVKEQKHYSCNKWLQEFMEKCFSDYDDVYFIECDVIDWDLGVSEVMIDLKYYQSKESDISIKRIQGIKDKINSFCYFELRVNFFKFIATHS